MLGPSIHRIRSLYKNYLKFSFNFNFFSYGLLEIHGFMRLTRAKTISGKPKIYDRKERHIATINYNNAPIYIRNATISLSKKKPRSPKTTLTNFHNLPAAARSNKLEIFATHRLRQKSRPLRHPYTRMQACMY